MIATPTGWIHEHDLRRRIPGREDDVDLVEGCISYLKERSATHPESSVRRSHLTRSKLISARIAKAAASSRAGGDVATLRQEVARQGQTIDRLLALVKPRGAPVAEDRLTEIVAHLATEAYAAFPGAAIVPIVSNEQDPDTTAARTRTSS